ncbi:MAG: CvpA family protein [Myxococcota bacterium]|nr:CvpA family protein [Myxococcota bacterium]
MATLDTLTLLDGIVLVVLLIAIARGIFIGMVRECFSIAGLGAAVLAVRFGLIPVSASLEELSQGAIGPTLAPWIAGTLLAIGAIALMASISRLVQRGVRAAGLSWLDRSGGAALGAAEGVLVGMLIILGTTFVMGREHPLVDGSRSLTFYDAARVYLGEKADGLPSVAAPSEWL